MANKVIRCSRKDCKKQFRRQDRERVCPNCKTDDFFNSSFGKWYLQQAKRHRFEEAVKDSNIEHLYLLWKDRAKYNGLSYEEDGWHETHALHLSHLYPVKGEGNFIGKLQADNLLISPASINQRLGNKIFNVGVKVKGKTPLPASLSRLRTKLKKLVKIDEFQGIHKLKPSSNSIPKNFRQSSTSTLKEIAKQEVARLNLNRDTTLFNAYEIFLHILTGLAEPESHEINYFDYRTKKEVKVKTGDNCKYANPKAFHLANPEVELWLQVEDLLERAYWGTTKLEKLGRYTSVVKITDLTVEKGSGYDFWLGNLSIILNEASFEAG